MEDVTERRQQRKIFGDKKESKIRCYVAKKKPRKKNLVITKNFIFKLAKRMKHENQGIVGDKCLKNDEGCLTYNDSAKIKAWKSHYEGLLNVEFMWKTDSPPDLNPNIGPPLCITEEMISKAIAKMKTGKAAGPSGIVTGMIRSAGKKSTNFTNLANRIIKKGRILSDWNLSNIPGGGSTDAIFILCQLQEKHQRKHKPLYFVFVNLEKAFDHVPRKAL